ncbi:Crp/Fnr family transcriptional regulator [Pelomonas sp. SE-A7]|uniref:Crp/Fnr family transcriptional regulator n=1 Tax=Pelomonas sp. SE-A7 TaxID=3054953 RepID=UPI00259CFE0E|nr:Crp/Fnr family transcriptional regulator [Pelomonas sp. SE-A7]MDM4767308.1 Crp/Fnr family transcriptional regulator [Pelomonas sp. SE-A7]
MIQSQPLVSPARRPAGLPAPTVPDDDSARPSEASPLRLALRRALAGELVSPSALRALERLGQTRALRAGETLLRAGEAPVEHLWLLLDGLACTGKRDARNRWWQSRELVDGDWIDVASSWREPAVALETVVAQTPALACAFPASAVLALCDGEPGLMHALVRALADQLAAATLAKQALLTRDVTARLAAWLLEQHEAAGGAATELVLRQQKRLIASQLGITPETLSRTLKSLQDQGLVRMDHYRVLFRDLAQLRRLAARVPPLYSR